MLEDSEPQEAPTGPKLVARPLPRYAIVLVLLSLGILALAAFLVPRYSSTPKPQAPRSVIMMVSDGWGPAGQTMLRESTGSPLTLDSIFVGMQHTKSASSLVTDSAAGATAFSCGLRTDNTYIGVTSDKKPCATVLEGAKSEGLSVGIVVTSRVTHATPAAFSAHVDNRELEDDIAMQQAVDTQPDLMFGGGKKHFQNRTDGVDLLLMLQEQYAYSVVDSLTEAKQSTLPLIGLFSDSHMSYEMDRDPAQQPSLREMVEVAIEKLSANPKGFFLLIEGSRIDMASHGHDPAAHLHDARMFDHTVDTVIKFAAEQANTLVISTSDHETGGLMLAFPNQRDYAWDPSFLKIPKVSGERLALLVLREWRGIPPESRSDRLLALMEEHLGFTDISDEEVAEVQALAEEWETAPAPVLVQTELGRRLGELTGRRAGVAFTTTGHTGTDVNLYATGPTSSTLRGIHDNTDVAEAIITFLDMSVTMKQLQEQQLLQSSD